ncbi:hypothetical protein EJ04DRAFT_336815 [Polyplosphaeria fusca]|uniref:Putative lipoate-protein ligase A n=1 Tax=Polyplosphaeria fusca TaxID=682080 RepID=A0A9P4QWX5_9PLEO|nr:hypothetical protein EJ04DRAFT_336815 [Polyplosphaeria fusca]
MAPSRGLHGLRYTILTSKWPRSTSSPARRVYSTFHDDLVDPSKKVHSYISRSNDPYLNLSIEDYILRKSPADSTILFLYTNRPCVVVGRNQNPWREVNLNILKAADWALTTTVPSIGDVDLVRRRSGGGTVFHDKGNVNWSVTCPRGDFTRDKHAEMVVRALRKLGIDRAKVNERHDIVLDQGIEKRKADTDDTHRTPYTLDEEWRRRPLKVSGSAYKLTRARALHHATALLNSPNLRIISDYLRSPAQDFIKAKGVESVSSPITNIGLSNEEFQKGVQEEFLAMYAASSEDIAVVAVDDGLLDVADIRKGYDELLTREWIYAQTPQFTLTVPTWEDVDLEMSVHHGVIKSFDLEHSSSLDNAIDEIRSALMGQKLQDIGDWGSFLESNMRNWNEEAAFIAERLEELLPIPTIGKV